MTATLDEGNKDYLKIAECYKDDYHKANKHHQKSFLAKKVLTKINPRARFLKKRSGKEEGWSVMNEKDALKKIKQALREKDQWQEVKK